MNALIPAVRVASGSAFVKGKARRYPYVIARLYRPAARKKDGKITYRASDVMAGPFRSRAKADRAAVTLASEHRARLIPGYGSLHGAAYREDLATALGSQP
jgi:hypothetical protein